MDINRYSHIFMLGIGGIGMSALARFFHFSGKTVAGYDRTSTRLTDELQHEGIAVLFDDDRGKIGAGFSDPENCLVVFTPAIKEENRLLQHFSKNKFTIRKRAGMLGLITSTYKTIAVSGTHGKTTISSMIAHLLNCSRTGCTAFLGGIAKNYGSNFLHSDTSPYAVTEADEFDRSFLQLYPSMAVVTAVDADHLDIYQNEGGLRETYEQFIAQVESAGLLLVKKGIPLDIEKSPAHLKFTYALDNEMADVFAQNIHINSNWMQFDLVYPGGVIRDLKMKPGGVMNIENAVAATFIALHTGVAVHELSAGLMSFDGVRRRFDMQVNSPDTIYIDDYAHHPVEIDALIRSVRSIYPEKKITGIFQPHLYSRTRDFADEFAASLEKLDQVIVTEIYPAREKPIAGVSSAIIFDRINHYNKVLMHKNEVIDYLSSKNTEVLLTIGAGDIDTLVEPLKAMIIQKTSKNNSP